ncbi:hypothetical protein NC651_036693 [Populus alba x Populus x berolinensis]|uniref:Uncharacterized protein n=2 Tax=Populus alba x Populus x berolinensis TaxID=444605 RepID=A0AAD6MAK2_9ROSI|nr:hypothetical protein NC651_036693 [Populus alba x Populus x berolinensis]KAJ6981676.1 hypothetical protein NC653_024933 [Populus alba x Populus x berolinensis]KAJ7003195.1 hypothetical protein NC653_008440 [Populus alba x Populus x berolinensis]
MICLSFATDEVDRGIGALVLGCCDLMTGIEYGPQHGKERHAGKMEEMVMEDVCLPCYCWNAGCFSNGLEHGFNRIGMPCSLWNLLEPHA